VIFLQVFILNELLLLFRAVGLGRSEPPKKNSSPGGENPGELAVPCY